MSTQAIEQYYEQITHDNSFASYKGIPMLCEDGLHEAICDDAKRKLPAGANILDIGAGAGAFSLRMADNGFNVDACDQFDNCQCKDKINFFTANVENMQIHYKQYDAIFLIELAEHCESPRQLIQNYAKLLKPGGLIYITTPNVDSVISRAWFFLTGEHWYFDQKSIEEAGHIMPLHNFQLKYWFKYAEITMIDKIGLLENRQLNFGLLSLLVMASNLRQKIKGKPNHQGRIALYVGQARMGA